MDEDQFTEYSSQSWFGRIMQSIKGVAVGFLLIIVSIGLLAWNENRSVVTARSLGEGSKVVIPVSPEKVDPSNQSKLIHVSGDASASGNLSDPIFQVTAPALRLTRKAEMYQWKEEKHEETEKKFGGGTQTRTTYSYSKTWSDSVVDSSNFKKQDGHRNPSSMEAEGETKYAENATLGAFKLPVSVLSLMKGDAPLAPTEADLAKLPERIKGKAKINNNFIYLGADSGDPKVGDERISFTIVKPGTYSILARQTGDTLEPYLAKAGGQILRVESGTVSADTMFQNAAKENAFLAWVLRLVGFIVMSIGIGMIAGPIVVFADVIPFVGNFLGAGVFMVAVGLGFVGSLVTIAVAWIAVRPLLGVALLVVAGGALFMAYRRGQSKVATIKAAKAGAVPA